MPSNPTLRGTSQFVGQANPSSCSLPSGTVAGDTAIILCGGGDYPQTPSGWTPLFPPTTAANWNTGGWYKVLDASDISAGSVSVSWRFTFYVYVTLSVFIGGGLGCDAISNQASSGASSQSLTYPNAALANDVMLYFGSNAASTTLYDTVNRGTLKQQGQDMIYANGCLYAETLASNASAGSISPTFSYPTAGSGHAESIVRVTPVVSAVQTPYFRVRT